MKQFALVATIWLLLASVAYAADDSNTIYPLDALNPTSSTFNGIAYPGELFNALSSEDAGRQYEQGIGNCVSTEASVQSCLAGTSAGLTMTPGSCIAYNQMWRSTETGSVTFPNSSTCWLAMDENTTGSNAGLTNFTRVTATHYLLDCIDATQPTMAADSQLLLKVTTSGGAITIVKDLRNICALGTCGGGIVNGIINVMDFGARGDTAIGTDGTVSSNYNFTSASLNCSAARVGETIHVVAAGSAAALLQTTIASCSGNTFVMLAAAAESISGTASWVIGHDDTTAIQTAQGISYNAAGFATNALYFPAGRYLATAALNFTNAANQHVYGAGMDVSTIFCSSSGQSVCVDDSGGNNNQWDHISIISGLAVQNSPTANFLKARVTLANEAIGDRYSSVAFKTWGPWNFYGFYNEQATWHDDYFEADGTSTVNLTISSANTAGLTSPFVTFIAESGYAATDFSIDGAATAFQTMHGGGAGKALIFLDGGNFQNINLRDFFFGDGSGTTSAGMTLLGDQGNADTVVGLYISGIIGNMESTTSTIINLSNSTADRVFVTGNNDPGATDVQYQFQFVSLTASNISFQANRPLYITSGFCGGTDLPGATQQTHVTCPYANYIAGNIDSVRTFVPTYVTSQINGLYVYGALQMALIADPLAPIVTSLCTVAGSEHCNSSCTYYTQYQDIAGDVTNVSPGTTITNCPNTLTSTNKVEVLPQYVGGEFIVNLLKNSTSNLLGFIYPSDYSLNPGGYLSDIGQAAYNSSYTAGSNNTGRLHLEGGNGVACSGLQALSTGAATVAGYAGYCISGTRPILCTDNTANHSVGCVPSAGSLVITGTSSDMIAWVQL